MDVLQLLNLTERNSLFQGRKKGTDNSFRKLGGEWGESAKVYIVSFDPHNHLMT